MSDRREATPPRHRQLILRHDAFEKDERQLVVGVEWGGGGGWGSGDPLAFCLREVALAISSARSLSHRGKPAPSSRIVLAFYVLSSQPVERGPSASHTNNQCDGRTAKSEPGVRPGSLADFRWMPRANIQHKLEYITVEYFQQQSIVCLLSTILLCL